MLDLDLEFTIYGGSLNIICILKIRGWIRVSNLDLFSHDQFLNFWILCVCENSQLSTLVLINWLSK
jgi:hypothetical protein